jgi:Rps23 Pro-64 3,4-dihydroxylase Tpa1-like proline 4-hydroxylase
MELINPIDRQEFRSRISNSVPFPHICVDNFLDEAFANEIYNAFPSFHEARGMGKEFDSVNEKLKIQITNSSLFAPPIARLNQLLASKEFVEWMSEAFDVPNVLADPDLVGGGIHETNAGGRLDVHVDFNYVERKRLHRRLNILIYFNKGWSEDYGGYLELWDKDVKNRVGYFAPVFNRFCAFATSDISFHGVTPLTCPSNVVRRSFATYYYTKEAPAGWDGKVHSTIFKARPEEWMRGNVLMPVEASLMNARQGLGKVKQKLKTIIGK